MAKGYFSHGFRSALDRPGLAGLLYAFNLVLAVVVTVPLYLAIGSTTNFSGFSGELARQFDITLWMDVLEEVRITLQAMQVQLLWIVPLYLLWKAAASVGIIHTLQTGGVRGFWHGIGEFTGRAALLALLFLVPLVVLGIGITIVTVFLSMAFSGEIGAFWVFGVVLPIVVILGLALLDLMHDYARMEIVVGRKPVMESYLKGLAWPFRHAGSLGIYALWFVIGAILFLLPTIIDVQPGGLWGVFLLQQVVLFARAGVTVGWFGSELGYYNDVVTDELPLIATERPPEAVIHPVT